MEIRTLDGATFHRMLCGGAGGLRSNVQLINDLNVFPVPDGDTGTNMSRTIESGLAKLSVEDQPLGAMAHDVAQGMLFGARGNSGVILSQFFAGLCGALTEKETATVGELAEAYRQGVTRAYAAVVKPVEGTILTVLRESAEYAGQRIAANGTLNEFLRLTVEEAERSLERTKEILPILTEADVVDSGGAGYLCIAKGMYESLQSDAEIRLEPSGGRESKAEINYDLFTADSVLEYGYCTECLVRLQRVKAEPSSFDEKAFADELEAMGCDSIVALKDGDVLKVHAHTATPAVILTLCQRYGEFLNVKIENMSLQHSDKAAASEPKKKKPHKTYGVVTVATGDGMTALLESLGADVVINGGQTGNPAAEQFLEAFDTLDADHILVFPNNSNILLTATQAAELWTGNGRVTVIPTKTIPEGYVTLSVFNPSVTDLDEQVEDLLSAKEDVVSGEVTVAVRDTVIHGVSVKEGQHIGILDGELVASDAEAAEVLCEMLRSIDDLGMRELITLFVGAAVSEEQRVRVTEILEERFPELSVEVYVGGQDVYDYLIAVE